MSSRKLRLLLPSLLTLIVVFSGCGTRFILERPGTVGVLLKEVKGASVMLPDKDGNPTPGTVDLPVGTMVKSAEQGVTK